MTRDYAASILRVVVWFALVAGLAEGTLLLVKYFVFHRFTWTSPHIIWMAPASNVILLFLPGLALALLAWFRPALVPLSLLGAALGFVSATGLLVVGFNGGLAPWAIGLIALGFAVRLYLGIRLRPDRFLRLTRGSLPFLAGVVLLLGVALPGAAAVRERLSVGRLPEGGQAPNVLLIILDTVRAASLSLYGYDRETSPNLAGWAQRGTVFQRAVATSSWTLPSHGSMFTGRWPHELSGDWQVPLDDRFPTLAEVLRAKGYYTAGFVANPYYTTRESGLNRGFIHYEDLPISFNQLMRSGLLGQFVEGIMLRGGYSYHPERTTGRKAASDLGQSFLDWLPQADGKPFFAFLNYFDAHRPNWNRGRFAGRFTGTPRQPWDLYDESILYLDDAIGSLLGELERRDLLRTTLVVITSDHGEQFGGHAVFGHGNTLYRSVLRVPLILILPGVVPDHGEVTQPVTLRDLPRTIVDLVGIEQAAFPGTSLASLWRGGSYPDSIFAELSHPLVSRKSPLPQGPMQSQITGSLHYIRYSTGAEELFDLSTDSLEKINLVDSTRWQPQLPRFRRALAAHLSTP
jgi:arylsulfatase A-like enzyme